MRQPSVRFGVSDGHDLRGATWKLWTETARGESDVYLACRSLGGVLKVSMHQSGDWHQAYGQRVFEEQVAGAIPEQIDRFVKRWRRPAPIAPGITLAIRILTPALAVSTPRAPSERSEIVWVPNGPAGRVTEIAILFTASSDPWPGRDSMQTSLIGSIPLSSGETVWAVYRVDDLPVTMFPGTGGSGRFFRGRAHEDLVEADSQHGVKGLAWGLAPDGSMLIGDFAATMAPAGQDSPGSEAAPTG